MAERLKERLFNNSPLIRLYDVVWLNKPGIDPDLKGQIEKYVIEIFNRKALLAKQHAQ